jgi:hypothetical protein
MIRGTPFCFRSVFMDDLRAYAAALREIAATWLKLLADKIAHLRA